MPRADGTSQCASAIGALLRDATAALTQAASPDAAPRLEAELLMVEATGWPRTRVLAWPERTLAPPLLAAFLALLERRLAGEPMAYIRGRQAFWTLDLRVTPDTLIPRPETELLVEIALGLPDGRLRVADLGTGSGAIAAAIALERPAWSVLALDYSPAALGVAAANLAELGLGNCHLLRANWLAPIADRTLDLILANPPYVPAADPHLNRGDLRFEPHQALASGPDGLADIRLIAAQAQRCLVPGGLVAVEHGFDQGPAVRQLFTAAGLIGAQTRRDLAGQGRVTMAWAASEPEFPGRPRPR